MTNAIETDAKELLEKIEDFFEHLFSNTPADQHEALAAAKVTVIAAATPTVAAEPEPSPEPTSEPAPTPEPTPAPTGAA